MANSLPTATRWRRHASHLAMLFLIFTVSGVETFAQEWTFSLNQRRANDHIFVEIWAKAEPGDTNRLGEASLTLDYNTTFLRPTSTTSGVGVHRTDSINFDIDQANPVVNINSQFHSGNGYQSLGAQAYESGSDKKYGLEVRMSTLGSGGLALDSTGRGSFLGRLWFEIIGSPTDSSTTDITWNTDPTVGDLRLFDRFGNDVEAQTTFASVTTANIVGITVLNPNGPSEVVDRDKLYTSVNLNNNGGYPIYFERSGLALGALPGTTATAYLLEYSLNGGSSWIEFGRVAESTLASVAVGSIAAHVGGDISTNATTAFITTHTGANLTTLKTITAANFFAPLRVVWNTDAQFSARSEDVRIRITQLTKTSTASIASRTKLNPFDISDASFVLGRLFFMQLDGATQYGKSTGNFSNATQLTAETWINLNSYQATGSEPGVLASSAGAFNNTSTQEGAWMLYLADGRYPAFRAREIEGRGTGGYVGSIVSSAALATASDATPLGADHAGNWAHLAATVANDTLTLYVNGEIVGQSTNDSATDIRMGVEQQATNHPIWVGVNPNTSIESTDYLHAGLKGVKIWRTALTQDQIRQRVAGIANPTNTSATFSVHRALELLWTLEGTRTDDASETLFQNSADNLQFFDDGSIDNSAVQFRPDQPHLRLTAPVGCEGVSKATGATFSVRWIGYGIGTLQTTATTTADVDLLFSLDGGTSFTYLRGTTNTGNGANLGGPNGRAVDVEAGEIEWEPFRNTGQSPDNEASQSLNPLPGSATSDLAILRIRGRNGGDQNISDDSQEFQVADFFSFERSLSSIVTVDEPTDARSFSFSGQTGLIEAWIRPYRFPTDDEEFFPIVAKIDSGSADYYYALRLRSDGRLEFRITDENGVERTAISDVDAPLIEPNTASLDSAWTHVGAYVDLGNGTSQSDIRFYIDGVPQSSDTTITNQLGDSLSVEELNDHSFFIGYEPSISTTSSTVDAKGFLGSIRDVRFWNGDPNNNAPSSSTEPNDLTVQIQGAQSILGADIATASSANLVASFSMNGGSFVANGFNNAIPSNNSSIVARIYGGTACYEATDPYIKLVEPVYRAEVQNIETSLRVRWVGFNYSGVTSGNTTATAPALEYSIRGGGGLVIQPYQFVASPFWSTTQTASMTLPGTAQYQYNGGATGVQIAAILDVSNADPDPDDDEVYNATRGSLSATLTNARLRLTATTGTITTTGTVVGTVRSEGPLFTIVPQSNFTIRALLEGYHKSVTGGNITNIGTGFSSGGVRISLYEDNAGSPGALAATAESQFQYDALGLDPTTRGTTGTQSSTFANIPFVFSALSDGDYWVVVEHLNHLPVMSRFPATFVFAGDDRTTFAIESGWDFQSWNGTNANVLATATADPYAGAIAGRFTAFGPSINVTTSNLPGYSETGLIFNEGESGFAPSTNSMPALVGGDVERDGQINAGDRVQVSQDLLNTVQRSDVNGDGTVNAIDRDIVYRNFGKQSSIQAVSFPEGTKKKGNGDIVAGVVKDRDPFTYISPLDPEMSAFHLNAVQEAHAYWQANPEVHEKVMKRRSDNIQGASLKYVVTGDVRNVDDIVIVDMYIQNRGGNFGLGNCTFAITFPSSILEFVGMENHTSSPWHTDDALGYLGMVSGPPAGSHRPAGNARSIDVVYDSYARKPGADVPTAKTLIGTLRFRFKNPSDLSRPVFFSWNKATVVLDLNGRSVTGQGEFRAIKTLLPYSSTIFTPNGGEQWRAGRGQTVRWSNKGAETVFIEFSLDGGATWTRLNDNPINAGTGSYQWSVPSDANTQNALVRIIDEQSGEELDRSDEVFAIAPANGAIARPAPTDPIYTGGKADRIDWSSEGIDRVSFEFSSDGGITWEPLSAEGSGGGGSTGWIVPGGVNTKQAVVRMIDKENDEEVTRSGLFKVLAGDLEFREPREGDQYDVGSEERIRWTLEKDVELFDIDLSTNGGTTWLPMLQDVKASDFFTNWVIPELNAGAAQLRAYYPGDPELEYDRSPLFRIGTVSSTNDAEEAGYRFEELYPNPFSRETSLKFAVPVETDVTMTVFNAAGEKVAVLISGASFGAGEHRINFNASDLGAGIYYLRMEAGPYTLMRLAVVKR